MNKLFANTLLLIAGAVLGGLGAGSAFGYNIPQVKYSINEEHANDMLSRRIERLNRPVLDSIASLSASLDTIGTRLDKAVRIKDAVTGFLAAEKLKLKEKDQKEACAAVVREVLAGMSRDRILQYAEQKNRDKANSDKNREEALNKLSAKTAESLVKNTQKGNVADTHLSALLRDVLEEETLAAENLTVEKAVAEAGLTRLKASIIKAPEKFSAEFFNKIMDDEEIPVKKTTLTQAEHPGPSYEDLMRRYSNRELSTIRGKFDGAITDELTIFPDENSRVYDNPCGPDYEAYHRYIVKSKYGTTPILLQVRKLLSTSNIELLDTYWYDENNTLSGILLSLMNCMVSGTEGYTYVYHDGEWVNKAPLDPKYMTLDECLRTFYASDRCIGSPESLTIREYSYWDDPDTIRLAAFLTNSDNNPEIVFKSVIYPGDGSCDDLILPWNDTFSWSVLRNYIDYRFDALLIEYTSYNTRCREIYEGNSSEDSSLSFLNKHPNYGGGFYLREKQVYDNTLGQWITTYRQ